MLIGVIIINEKESKFASGIFFFFYFISVEAKLMRLRTNPLLLEFSMSQKKKDYLLFMVLIYLESILTMVLLGRA
jgi:hypothetical protein